MQEAAKNRGKQNMRNGYKVFDADTHIRPSAESLRPYLSEKLLSTIPDLEDHRVEIHTGDAGEKREAPYRHWYRFNRSAGWSSSTPRILGEAAPRDGAKRHFQTFMGSTFPTEGGGDFSPEVRLADMDTEGVDAHFIVHASNIGYPDPEMDMEFIYAQHRFLNDFCETDSSRLKSCIIINPMSIEGSVNEIKRWGKTDWAVAVQPKLPLDYPLDHPDLHPIWAAAQEHGLSVIHHSLAMGYPGYRDLWENPFLGRCASHPWAAMRAIASFFGGGLMERFPELRYAVLESGFGWLPFWARRMDDQVTYVGHVSEDLTKKISDYLTGGRFFAAIEQHEGADMAKICNDLMGDHILMFGSDYPHAESRFPESVDQVLAWEDTIGKEAMQKLLWDNPVNFFGKP
jgi:predicted TIM-barrel fold metal-dependent hydrolase